MTSQSLPDQMETDDELLDDSFTVSQTRLLEDPADQSLIPWRIVVSTPPPSLGPDLPDAYLK